MSLIATTRGRFADLLNLRTVLCALAFLVLLAAQGRAADALSYAKSYSVTGDYVVGGVGLRGTGVNGFATGTINISGVPAGADIVAAFLYWETEERTPAPAAAAGFFRGQAMVAAVRGNPMNPACWSSGGTDNASGRVYRADILRYLAVDPTTNVRIANGAHTVKLPDSGGNGNGNVLFTNGATMVVIYRLLAPGAAPLRRIVLYDGAFTMTKFTAAMTQTLGGLYDAVAGTARMTQIVGKGQSGFTESLSVNGIGVPGNPFVGAQGGQWDNPTINFNLADHAASFQTQVTSSHNQLCLTWSAIVASAQVWDSDSDGLLDKWETSGLHLNEQSSPATFGGCADFPAEPCVNLPAMGANVAQRNIFVEIDWLHGVDGHLHIPKYDALKAVADAFLVHGIRLLFDVGNNYQGMTYIVPAAFAQGGQVIEESSLLCPNAITPVCTFPSASYSVLSWKYGIYAIKNGLPLMGIPSHFKHDRKDIFHYALFAHALSAPSGTPGVTRSVSGAGDRGGGDFGITMGLWRSDNPSDDQTGTVLLQAGTLMHELGHNLGLGHAGLYRSPNCMPNYPSVMNYLYQTRGLTDVSGESHIDFSNGILTPLDELALPATLGTTAYRVRYFGPPSALDASLGRTAKSHCDGSALAGDLAVRLESPIGPIDWYNGTGLSGPFDVNFNGSLRDGVNGGSLFLDSNDWNNINLQQISARRSIGALSADVGIDAADLGIDAADLGIDAADLGIDAADLGIDAADLGIDAADLGIASTEVDYEATVSSIDPTGTSAGQLLKAVASLTGITLTWGHPSLGQIRQDDIFRTDDPGGVFSVPLPAPRATISGTPPATVFVDNVDGSTTLYNTLYTFLLTAKDINGTTSGPSNKTSAIVKHLFIKANDKSRAYGAPDPAFDFATTGMDPGLTGTTVCTTTATAASVPGNYPITCSGLTPVAGVTYTPGTLAITAAPVTATIVAANKTYDKTTTATVTSCALTGVFPADVGFVSCTGSPANFASANAGTWTVTASISLSGSRAVYYTLTSPTANTTATISKATPVVTAVGGRFFYDAAPHPATGSVTGVGGELLGTPVFTYAPGGASAPVEVGSYLATGMFAGNTNYYSATSASVSIKIDGFKNTGSMAGARSFHTATLLANGKVLVAGGLNASGGPLATGELYNPATGTFSATSNNMPNKAAGHTATLLGNGKVLVAGGGNSSSQLYDPATNKWSSAGGMSSQRSYHTATVLSNGKVLIAGGASNSGTTANTAQLFDPGTGNFTNTGNMTSAREFHSATLLPNGKVLIAGGRAKSGSSYAYRSSAELYDPATGQFTALSAAMTSARYGHAAIAIAAGPNSGKILIAGGANTVALQSAELYDPAAGTFSATSALAAARQSFTATVIGTGVLAAGGRNSSGRLATAEQYQGSAFVPSGVMRAARAAHAAVQLGNGSVLIVGGEGSAGVAISTAELFVVNP